MKNGQAMKFWKAIDASTNLASVLSAFEHKKGYSSKRTLQRYALAHDGFKKGQSRGEVSKRTNWSLDYVAKIGGWWESEFGEISPTSPPEQAHPKLELGSASVKPIIRKDRTVAKVATVEVSVSGGDEAKGCRGWLLTSNSRFRLSWVEITNLIDRGTDPKININLNNPAQLEVAITFAPFGELSLSPNEQSGVVHGKDSDKSIGWDGKGCWICGPRAPDNPDPSSSNYFPVGEYEVSIMVECDNGVEVSEEYALTSPASWDELELRNPIPF